MTDKKISKWMVAALLLLLLPQAMQGSVIRVLAIGNSFSDDAVEHYLYELAIEGGDTLIIGNAYRGGQGYESHWRVVEDNKADFEYRKIVAGNRTNERHTLLDCLKDEPWDIITFQQVSQDAGDDATNRARKAHPELKLLIPTGTAIQNGRTSYVGDRFCRDGYHLSFLLGRYTASLTWLEVITGQSAIGKKYTPPTQLCSNTSEITVKV